MQRVKSAASLVAVCAVTSLCLPAPAVAQPRVPDTAMSAVEGAIGVFLPGDPLDTAVTVHGAYQYFFTPRTGVRGTLGWTNPNLMGTGASLRQVRAGVDLLYNWEGGQWHPFAGAGGGAYFLQRRVGGQATGPSGTQAGVNLLGGVEYFASRRVAIKGEAAYHWISQGDLPWSPSGLALTIGIKRYF
jgi:hypothetical protein